ncbi:hypothetical protein U1Q18_001070 [Sarracenia purpurea var. burkii]
MEKESTDPTALVGSSIALLQERFRQLQRVREKGEEQEHRKLFPESERVTPTTGFGSGKSSIQVAMVCSPSPPSRSPAKFPSTDGTITNTSLGIESSEVDTSLHL